MPKSAREYLSRSTGLNAERGHRVPQIVKRARSCEKQLRFLRDRKGKNRAGLLVDSIKGDWKPAA
jgi:hypothetical protein